MTTTDLPAELLNIVELETIDRDLFRGNNETRLGPRLFGGQVLAQALSAAYGSIDDEILCHSLHGYFLRPGNSELPVLYHVDRIRDGRSFRTRRIKAVQKGEAIFSMDVSFHKTEDGLEHQIDMDEFPTPDSLEDDREVAERMISSKQISGWARRERPFDLRSVYPLDQPRDDDFRNPVWIRFRKPVADQRLNHLLMAYASDMGFVSTAFLPHRENTERSQLQMASLDHAIWFHRTFSFSDWLLYIKETTTATSSRGYNRGSFYTEGGMLVASAMQEGLMRLRD